MAANVGLWGGLACLVGRHVRSRGQARAVPEGWVSRCARCAIPMVRAHGGGSWQTVKLPRAGNADSIEDARKALLAKAFEQSRKAVVPDAAKDVEDSEALAPAADAKPRRRKAATAVTTARPRAAKGKGEPKSKARPTEAVRALMADAPAADARPVARSTKPKATRAPRKRKLEDQAS